MISLMRCALAHVFILSCFGMAAWYSSNLKNLLPSWGQTLIGLFYIIFIFCLFSRLDLFVLEGSNFHKPIFFESFWIFY